jgi:hypothetical protein
MKKYIPFIFPAIALLIVLFLGYRWYTAQTVKPDGKITDEAIEVEQLSSDEVRNLQNGSKDLPSVELKGSDDAMGQVRYEVSGDRVSFTITANLPELTEGMYQVWVRQLDSDKPSKAFVLDDGKAGYTGSASVGANMMPFEVIVSRETNNDDQIETTVLTGTIER